jgi:hypothetical protein
MAFVLLTRSRRVASGQAALHQILPTGEREIPSGGMTGVRRDEGKGACLANVSNKFVVLLQLKMM